MNSSSFSLHHSGSFRFISELQAEQYFDFVMKGVNMRGTMFVFLLQLTGNGTRIRYKRWHIILWGYLKTNNVTSI
jgi:hypothetical protein